MLWQSSSFSNIMIVEPEVRQEACGSVIELQYASWPLCPLRIMGSPGRDADDTASRIENVDRAIGCCSYCGQMHRKITRAILLVSGWMNSNPERTDKARDWRFKVEIPSSWRYTIVHRTHAQVNKLKSTYIRKEWIFAGSLRGCIEIDLWIRVPVLWSHRFQNSRKSSLTLGPRRGVWDTLNSDLQ